VYTGSGKHYSVIVCDFI